jgi:hypothetical protein
MACGAATYARPQLRLFAAGTGPFAGADALKYRYVSQLECGEARRMGLDDAPDTHASAAA